MVTHLMIRIRVVRVLKIISTKGCLSLYVDILKFLSLRLLVIELTTSVVCSLFIIFLL